ncbi:MAG TPA: preprotein translocase subunit SecA [Candidatus Azoamicus sp.]
MFFDILKIVFGSKNDRTLKKYNKILFKVNNIGLDLINISDAELRTKFFSLKNNFSNLNVLEELLPLVYAIVREVSYRTLKLRHFDVQILGGIAIYDNKVIEVATGEGKTLIATLPVCLFYLFEKPIHVVTVNDYLAKRDANWMKPIYDFLGISVGVLMSSMSVYDKKNAYKTNVVYGTCSEFGFDYLRDNIVLNKEDKVQNDLAYVIIDEIDSILIDEARTPLIISLPDKFDSKIYLHLNSIAKLLINKIDFLLDEKNKQVHLTEDGFVKLEFFLRKFGLLNSDAILYDIANINLLHDINSALKAIYFFKKDIDYLVKDNVILIIDEHTGRIMDGRRWSDGLHQALEAKENVHIRSENQVLASITFQNYFRLYDFLSGMTGTAYTEASEFNNIYNLDVVVIPTNKKCIRIDNPDLVFLEKDIKFKAVINDIKKCHSIGQPILVGTISIAVSEFLSDLLKKISIKHNVLNAKNHELESHIIAEAGRFGSVTIATNMAGRGTDIVLGGHISSIKGCDSYEDVVNLGGLRVIGTERHESRRIDNQLRGRCGRQGDPGSSQFYLSLEDDLVRIFIGDKIFLLINKLNISKNDVISHGLINKSIENAQKKVEAHNFELRKQLLEFDDIFNEQRIVFYNYRNFIIFNDDISVVLTSLFLDIVNLFFDNFFSSDLFQFDEIIKKFNFEFGLNFNLIEKIDDVDKLKFDLIEYLKKLYFDKKKLVEYKVFCFFEKILFLNVLDVKWKEHLLNLDYLKKGIHLRGYAHQDPKQEYKKESFFLFEEMLRSAKYEFILLFLKFPINNIIINTELNSGLDLDNLKFNHNDEYDVEKRKQKISRNSLCQCKSGKKYKHCHGKEV